MKIFSSLHSGAAAIASIESADVKSKKQEVMEAQNRFQPAKSSRVNHKQRREHKNKNASLIPAGS